VSERASNVPLSPRTTSLNFVGGSFAILKDLEIFFFECILYLADVYMSKFKFYGIDVRMYRLYRYYRCIECIDV
jgi:hypothetical protein